jgi:acetoin utilization protein AcuB
MRDIAIDRLMTTDPVTVGPDDTIAVAQQLFESGDIHHLPVVDNGLLVGIVSSSDLFKFHLLDGGPTSLSTATVRQVMEVNPVALKSGASLRDAAIRLSVGGYHALPVVEADGTLLGIVTTGDLVGHLLEQIPRGDGSLREISDPEDGLSENQIAQTLRIAEQTTEDAGDLRDLSQLLLYLRDRNQLLEQVGQAAEHYMRSGHGEHEHSVLVKRLADLQAAHHTDL